MGADSEIDTEGRALLVNEQEWESPNSKQASKITTTDSTIEEQQTPAPALESGAFSRLPSPDLKITTTTSTDPSPFYESASPDNSPRDGAVIITRSWNSVVIKTIVHFVSVAISAYILSLNFQEVYYANIGAPNIGLFLNSLQFAAKAHEILMCASLSAIVIHRIRYDLLGNDGVPLGLSLAGYNLASNSYLRSQLCLQSLNRNFWRWLPLSILVVGGWGLSLVVGPSSAILIIPTQDWWEIKTPFGQYMSVYTNISYDAMWPQTLSKNNVPEGCISIDTQDLQTSLECPSAGFETIHEWSTKYMNQGVQPNFTITDGDPRSTATRYLTAVVNDGTTGYTVSSSVMEKQAIEMSAFVKSLGINHVYGADATWAMAAPKLTESKSYKKPLVQVECAMLLANATSWQFPHQSLTTPPMNKFTEQEWDVPTSLVIDALNWTNETNPRFFTWVDVPILNGGPSLTGFFTFWTWTASFEKVVMPCTVDARWVNVSIWFDPLSGDAVNQDTPDPGELPQDIAQSNNPAPNPITISPEWVSSLDPQGSFSNGRSVVNLVEGLGYDGPCPPNPQDNCWIFGPPVLVNGYAFVLSMHLGLYLTDALARVNSAALSALYTPEFASEINGNGVENLEQLNFGTGNSSWSVEAINGGWNGWTESRYTLFRNGYSWGKRSPSVWFSIIILLLHAALALAHIIIIVSGRWTCKTWESVEEFLVLALNSRPSWKLRGMSAGVKRAAIWKLTTHIRIDKGTLGIVLKDRNSDFRTLEGRVDEGKKYQ